MPIFRVLAPCLAVLGLAASAECQEQANPSQQTSPSNPAPLPGIPPRQVALLAPPALLILDDDGAILPTLHPTPTTSGKQIFVQTVCVKVPEGFLEKAGLETAEVLLQREQPPAQHWVLSPREARMLNAILRLDQEKEILTRPQIQTLSGQTATVRIGQDMIMMTGLEAIMAEGKKAYIPKEATIKLGHVLSVTPTLEKDGTIQLRVVASDTTPGATVVNIPVTAGSRSKEQGVQKSAVEAPIQQVMYLPTMGKDAIFNVQQIDAAVLVPEGKTLVLRSYSTKAKSGSRMDEVLWILTPQAIEQGK